MDSDRERIYQNALLLMEGHLYEEAAQELGRIPDYRDAAKLRTECEQKKEAARLDDIYEEADKAAANRNVRSQEKAIRLFGTIPGWRDADQRIEAARRAIDQIQAQERVDRQEAIRRADYEKNVVEKRRRRRIRAALIGVACAAACVAGMFLYRGVVAPALNYRKAVRMIEADRPEEAYRLLHGLDFLDSGELVYEIARERLSEAEVGSTVQLGYYPPGSRASGEKDQVDWIVLDRDGSKLLLISKYALDCLPYESANEMQTESSWETCLLRHWLNDTFLTETFDGGETRILVRTELAENAREGGAHVSLESAADRVFLLSAAEAEQYFATMDQRQCLPTRYAIGRGAYQSSVGNTCFWWLRTTVDHTEQTLTGDPTENITRAALVGSSGGIVEIGHYMANRQYAVRPVIRVDIDPEGEVQWAEGR